MSSLFERFLAGEDRLSALLRALPAHEPGPTLEAAFLAAAARAQSAHDAVSQGFDAPASLEANFLKMVRTVDAAQAPRREAVMQQLAQGEAAGTVLGSPVTPATTEWLRAQSTQVPARAEKPAPVSPRQTRPRFGWRDLGLTGAAAVVAALATQLIVTDLHQNDNGLAMVDIFEEVGVLYRVEHPDQSSALAAQDPIEHDRPDTSPDDAAGAAQRDGNSVQPPPASAAEAAAGTPVQPDSPATRTDRTPTPVSIAAEATAPREMAPGKKARKQAAAAMTAAQARQAESFLSQSSATHEKESGGPAPIIAAAPAPAAILPPAEEVRAAPAPAVAPEPVAQREMPKAAASVALKAPSMDIRPAPAVAPASRTGPARKAPVPMAAKPVPTYSQTTPEAAVPPARPAVLTEAEHGVDNQDAGINEASLPDTPKTASVPRPQSPVGTVAASAADDASPILATLDSLPEGIAAQLATRSRMQSWTLYSADPQAPKIQDWIRQLRHTLSAQTETIKIVVKRDTALHTETLRLVPHSLRAAPR